MSETNDKRPRGILSPADREYLDGEKDLSQGSERNTRQRIRERVRQSLYDFEILWATLPDKDLEQIFYPEAKIERFQIQTVCQSAMAFIILGLWTSRDPNAQRVEDAIEQAAYADNKLATVNFDVETEPLPSGDVLMARLRESIKRTTELQNRLDSNDLSDAEREAIGDEFSQVSDKTLKLFEAAISDPAVDAEALAQLDLMGGEFSVAEIQELQEAQENTSETRSTPPMMLNKENEPSVTVDDIELRGDDE